MARRFILLYTGREGSSPIISTLGRHPGVCVPVFEEFDRGNFLKIAGIEDLPAAMDRAFWSGRFEPGEASRAREMMAEEARTEKSVGFKWRPRPEPGVLDVMNKHEVVMFILMRRNVLQRALSIYFTHNHLENPNVQFQLVKMNDEEAAEYVGRIRAMQFKAEVKAIAKTIQDTIRTKEMQLEKICRVHAGRGGLITPILYEDFVEDPLKFMNSMLNVIGQPEFSDLPRIPFRKTNRRNIENQVTNLNEIYRDPKVSRGIERYVGLIEEMQRLGGNP